MPAKSVLALLLAGAVAVLALASCVLFQSDLFPAELTLVMGQADLSSVIPASPASSFVMSILRDGSDEYIILYSTSPFDSTQNHLVVLSPDLKVLNTYTADDIAALNPSGVPFGGSSAVTHLVDGHIVIGNVEAVPTAGGLALLDKLSTPLNPVNVQLAGWTIVGPTSANVTWSGFGVDSSNNFTWTQYSSIWSTSGGLSQALGRSVQICGVFTDPENASSNIALLVFNDGSSNTQYFFQVLKNPDLLNGLFGPPLFNNPAYTPFTKSGLNMNDIFVTNDSIVAFEDSSRSWIRFSPQSPDAVTRLTAGKRTQGLKDAFSFSGKYFCTWDPDTRLLVKKALWW